jgi:hypothetical protein
LCKKATSLPLYICQAPSCWYQRRQIAQFSSTLLHCEDLKDAVAVTGGIGKRYCMSTYPAESKTSEADAAGLCHESIIWSHYIHRYGSLQNHAYRLHDIHVYIYDVQYTVYPVVQYDVLVLHPDVIILCDVGFFANPKWYSNRVREVARRSFRTN